jgi:TorA maturation chaperone TorD
MKFLNINVLEHISKMNIYLERKEDLDRIKVEYAKLFVGPYNLKAPPYGSVYLETENRVMHESTFDALKLYRSAGLDMAVDFKEPPDHISAELEFMSFLIFKELESRSINDIEAIYGFNDKQSSFMMRHLGVWVSDFLLNIEENAETEFYLSLTRLTKSFIKRDMEELSGNYLTEKPQILIGDQFQTGCLRSFRKEIS